jgi:hypothetical protein
MMPLAVLVSVLLLAAPVPAQAPTDGRVLVTVVDQSGAVIPSATVTIAPLDPAAKAAAFAPATTTDKGIATIPAVPPGRYRIEAEFPGFEKGLLKEVRIRPGDNKHVVVLPLQKMQDTVTVSRDAREAALDPRGLTFGSALTREQIEALSDDPDEMQRQLQEMAGADAVLRVDSFEGGKLPPKAQIKAIHITRDSFAAENHYAGGVFVDIITQPGIGALRGSANYRIRDGSMSGSNPFTPKKGPERAQTFGTYVTGPLLKQKSSFSVSINRTASFASPNLNAALPTGTVSKALSLRGSRNDVFVSGYLDYAITRDQTMRVGYYRMANDSDNLGVGAYDLPERAYSNRETYQTFRLQEAGPLGRRFFTNTRLQVTWNTQDSHSVTEAPTIRVNDAFTAGGQQIAGGRKTRTFNLASDLDYVRGRHSVRGGIVMDGGRYHSDDTSNYLGTYVFESLAAYEAGLPRSFVRRIGNPNITYWNLQAGGYVQDDIRLRKSLTFSPGLRYEVQTHLTDFNNIGPRFGLTWAPFKSGKTTLRTSWGIFYDWLNTGNYEQALRVDGFRQQELQIVNPLYPDPGDTGRIPPVNRYVLGSDLPMARTTRVSAGISQRLTTRITASATYATSRGIDLPRGRNLNAPVNGVRPDPSFGNIVEAVSDGRARQHTLSVNLSANISQPSPALAKARFNWRRTNFNVNYGFGRIENNTDGAFSLPATGRIEDDWGPMLQDVRHRFNAFVNTSALKNLSASLYFNGASGYPYTIRTGRDDNGDLVFNDRPAGVGRNTERGRGQFNASANLVYTIPFGKRTVALPPGISITMASGAPTVSTYANPDAARYRLMLTCSINNLTNHRNYSGFSGTMTSPFFRQPTMVTGTRKVDLGLGFSF